MTEFRLWLPLVGAFVMTVCAVLALRPLAFAVGLLDRPGGHKTHHGVVPVVGGLGMLLGISFGLLSASLPLGTLHAYLFCVVLLAVIGMLDDRLNLSPRLRLVVEFAAVLPMFFAADIRLTSFGDLLGTGPLELRGLSLIGTAIVAMAAINCFNMLDGMDGLAGGISLVASLLMVFLSSNVGHDGNALLACVLSGAIAGFLVFNAPVRWNRKVRCFMGDAGSTLLGFSLAWLMIRASQGTARLAAPITMAWLVAVPATDLVWTVIRRLWRGKSPMHPDTGHLHHMLRDAGLGARAVFGVMIGLSLAGGLIGLKLERSGVPEWASFALLVAGGTLLVVVIRHTTFRSPLVLKRIARRSFTG